MVIKEKGLNWQAILIENAQSDIKVIIRNAMLGQNNLQNLSAIRHQVQLIIKNAVNQISIPDLKLVAKQTLERFAETLLLQCLNSIGFSQTESIYILTLLMRGTPLKAAMLQVSPPISQKLLPEAEYIEIAQPSQEYSKDYFERVKPILDEIIKSEPKYSDNVSLRNVAEMTVRYDKTMKSIEQLKASGINLVQSSQHANCSKRCEAWQGGHYTLDGTYQIVDGIQFQPLENATDQFYTTKSGKVYKNGHITGYNCRHYLIPYKKGNQPIMVSAETIERERAIDKRMRELERQVRGWKETALIYKGVDAKKFKRAKENAVMANERYIEFARANKRAYYPSRTQIL